MRSCLVVLMSLCLAGAWSAPSLAVLPASPADLKAEKLKSLYRREPRSKEFVAAIEKKVAAAGASPVERRILAKTSQVFDQIVMASTSLSEDRLRDAVDLLEAMTGTVKQPPLSELPPLQERYAKLCARLDDQLFVRDLEAVLSLHDRFVRHTALGLWDKDQINTQLQRMEDAFGRAPEIPYGRSELLRNLQGKRLAAPAKGCYGGVLSEDELFLSMDRMSVGVAEESTGGSLPLDAADFVVQGPDGALIDLDRANHPYHVVPFCPPLSLWVKSRLLEGHIPCVNFKLVDKATRDNYAAGGESALPADKIVGVEDLRSGKIDQYLEKNFKLLGESKAATLVCLIPAFDREPAATAFGADGKTPYYDIVDPKLAKLPEAKRQSDVESRLKKGALTKDAGAELRNHYGDPAVPDGPERVRDAWKHAKDLLADAGANCVSLCAFAGSFHGNKKALNAYPLVGAQDWNKLEYYFPGEGIIDWVGTNAAGSDPAQKPGEANLPFAIDQFMAQVRSSNWHSAPVILADVAPTAGDRSPAAEAAWLSSVFMDFIPNNYPEVKAFMIDYPAKVCLWHTDAHGALRKYVSSNPYYKKKISLSQAPAGKSGE